MCEIGKKNRRESPGVRACTRSLDPTRAGKKRGEMATGGGKGPITCAQTACPRINKASHELSCCYVRRKNTCDRGLVQQNAAAGPKTRTMWYDMISRGMMLYQLWHDMIRYDTILPVYRHYRTVSLIYELNMKVVPGSCEEDTHVSPTHCCCET